MSRTKVRPDQVKVNKTAVFQIHAPTQRRKAMLHDAMYRYHLAFTHGLKILLDQIDHLKNIEKNDLKGEIKKLTGEKMKARPLSNGAKSGLQEDFHSTIQSHIELLKLYEKNIEGKTEEEIEKRGGIPGKPTIPPLIDRDEEWADKLDAFLTITTLEDESKARDNLLRESKAGQLRPIIFPRSRLADGFLLLRNPETDRYYIYLNLHAKDSRWAKQKIAGTDGQVKDRKTELKDLVIVGKNEAISQTTKTGTLFPINFAKNFQFERFICKAQPKTAKLIKKHDKEGGEQYYVHVSFEYVAQKLAKPLTMLGVDRGIHNLASLAVIDFKTGAVLDEVNIDGKDLRFIQRKFERRQKIEQKKGKIFRSKTRKAEADKAVHRTANKIVELALKHKSQVIMENLSSLSNRSGKRGRSNFNRLLNRSQYQKLLSVLEYKLKLEGLPYVKKIHPAGTSITCPECGYADKKNRNRSDPNNMFDCQNELCDYKHDADLNAARVIALKKQWRLSIPEKEAKKPFAELENTDYNFASYLTSLISRH